MINESSAGDKPLEEQTKQRILGFLPDAISQALKSYYMFVQQDSPEEAKAFSAHHSACKVAIAHIELLIKLARWADIQDEDGGNDDAVKNNHQAILTAMLNEAQGELKNYKKRQSAEQKKS